MAQSPEYPDLPWMPPRSWTNANRARVRLIVIHTTEGAARTGAARDGAAYDQRRTDGTSAHYYVDDREVVQCVRTADVAHTAMYSGNQAGIHTELCARAYQIDWNSAYAQSMLRRAARQCARDADGWKIPVRKLTAAQVAAGEEGFCGHVDISNAWHESDHTDPGPRFPWAAFLAMVNDEMGDGVSAADVYTALESERGREALRNIPLTHPEGGPVDPKTGKPTGYTTTLEAWLVYANSKADGARANAAAAVAGVQALAAAVAALGAQLGADTGRVETALAQLDEQLDGLAADTALQVLAGLTPEAIAGAIPDGIAEDVVAALAARIAA